MRWAETTLSSDETPSSSRTATAASSVGKSERLPPTMPTRGAVVVVRSVMRLPPCRRPRTVAPGQRERGTTPSSTSSPSAVRCPILRRSNTRALVVQVEVDGRVGQGVADTEQPRLAGRAGAEQIDHRRRRDRVGRAEPEAADGADVLLELRGRGTLDRPVAAVVDPRGQLVDDERAVAQEEQLRGQRAGQVHRVGQAVADVDGTRGDGFGDRCGRHGFEQDAPRRGRSGRSGRSRSCRRRPRATMTESSVSKSSSRSARRAVAGFATQAFERVIDVGRRRRGGPGRARRSRR